MLSREKLLHPATAIAMVALFVALSGVTYAATRIGTSQIADSAVTRAKLADGAVTRAKLALHAVGQNQLARGAVTVDTLSPGTALTGNGSAQPIYAQVPDGQSKTLFVVQGIGAMSAACAAGVSTVSWANTGAPTVTVDGMNAGAGSPVPFLSTATPAVGATVTGPAAGAGGVQSATWQVSWPNNNAGLAAGFTFWMATSASGTSCVITGQELETALLPPGGI
jgi:hypothetical protein